MMLLVGILIVFGATLGGFMVAGGNPLLLLHISEFIVIGGIALGLMVIASPTHVLKEIIVKIRGRSPAGTPARTSTWICSSCSMRSSCSGGAAA